MALRRPLLEAEIREAQDMARSAAEAARLLNVSYNTYLKYVKMYGIADRLKNPTGIGIPKGFTSKSSFKAYPLQDIFDNKHPNYPRWKLIKRLYNGGYKEQKCECCGFDEKRITDGKSPLKLAPKDGNVKNLAYENLEVLCFNCYFLQVGDTTGQKKQFKWK